MLRFWFQFSFPFFSLYYFLKLFILLETSSPGNQLPSHHAGQAVAIFKNRADFPSHPKQGLLRMPRKVGVSPCLAGCPGGSEGTSATTEVSDCGTQSGFCFLPVF